MYHNLSWRESLGKKWRMQAGLSYTYNRDDIAGGLYDQDKQEVLLQGLSLKIFNRCSWVIISMLNWYSSEGLMG